MAVPRTVPFHTPDWVTERGLFLLAVGIGTASTGALSVQGLITAKSGVAVLTICTSAIAVALAWRATRRNARTTLWFLLGGPLAGCLNSGLSCALTTAFHHDFLSGFFGGLLVGATFGGLFALPLGLAYGLGMLLAHLPLRATVPSCHEQLDRTAVWLGGWLLVVGMIDWSLSRSAWTGFPLWTVTFGVGGLLIGAGITRILARMRWLRRVQAGKEAGWQIIAYHPNLHDGLAPLLRLAPSIAADGVVIYRQRGSLSPYRDGGNEVPVARVAAMSPASI